MGQQISSECPEEPIDETPKEALEKAEQIDHYLEAVSNSNINTRARAGQEYAPMNSTFLKQGAGRIIEMMPSADAGFPHTRGNDIICIPAYYPAANLKKLLIHERIHLHQKANREAYKKFYETSWNFQPNRYKIPENIKNHMRLNPDTIGWPIFIWKDTWIPMCLFHREDKPSLRECSYCWYNPKEGVLLKTMPPAWREFFGDVGQSEHPNELSACYGADYDLYKDVPAAKLYHRQKSSNLF